MIHCPGCPLFHVIVHASKNYDFYSDSAYIIRNTMLNNGISRASVNRHSPLHSSQPNFLRNQAGHLNLLSFPGNVFVFFIDTDRLPKVTPSFSSPYFMPNQIMRAVESIDFTNLITPLRNILLTFDPTKLAPYKTKDLVINPKIFLSINCHGGRGTLHPSNDSLNFTNAEAFYRSLMTSVSISIPLDKKASFKNLHIIADHCYAADEGQRFVPKRARKAWQSTLFGETATRPSVGITYELFLSLGLSEDQIPQITIDSGTLTVDEKLICSDYSFYSSQSYYIFGTLKENYKIHISDQHYCITSEGSPQIILRPFVEILSYLTKQLGTASALLSLPVEVTASAIQNEYVLDFSKVALSRRILIRSNLRKGFPSADSPERSILKIILASVPMARKRLLGA